MKNSELKSIFSKLINNPNNKSILSNNSNFENISSNQLLSNFIPEQNNVKMNEISTNSAIIDINLNLDGPKIFINFYIDNSYNHIEYKKLFFLISLIASSISNQNLSKFIPGNLSFFIFTNNFTSLDFRSNLYDQKKIFRFFEKKNPDMAINISLSSNINKDNFIFIEKNMRSINKEITFLSKSLSNSKNILDSSYNFYYNAINFIRDTFLDSDDVKVTNSYGYFTPKNHLKSYTKITTSNNVNLEKYSSKIDSCIQGAAIASEIEINVKNSHSNFSYHSNHELDNLFIHNINSVSKNNVSTKFLSDPHPMNDLSLILPTTTINANISFTQNDFTIPQSLGMTIIDLLNSKNSIYTKIKKKSYAILSYDEYYLHLSNMNSNKNFNFIENYE